MRILGIRLLGVLAITLAAGCNKSKDPAANPPSQQSNNPSIQQASVLARVHWLGKDKLASETNAAHFMKIWGEPESARVEAQTLDKLALALGGEDGHSEAGSQNPTNRPLPISHRPTTNYQALIRSNPSASLARPLLDDLVRKEWYLEIIQTGSEPAQLAIAIRLDDQRAALWQTNLDALTNTLNASTLQRFSFLSLRRSNDWSIIDLVLTTATNRSSSLQPLALSLQPSSPTNWLEADLDLPRLTQFAAFSSFSLFRPLHHLTMAVTGDGENVRTRGELAFPGALPPLLEPWRIPTNLVREPLISFTAARGVAPLLQTIQSPFSFPSNAVPNQMYLWDNAGAPFSMFFALPDAHATTAFGRIAPSLMQLVNPRLIPRYGSITNDADASSLVWEGLPHGNPFLQVPSNSSQELLFGGFGPPMWSKAKPMPQELLSHVLDGTNLVYFDWEVTGQRLVHWRYLDDVYRILFDLHGPRLTYTPSLHWIETNLTNLSFAVTEVKLAESNRLAFARKSTVGLSALEIDLLANWIELPEFPNGLSTLLATNPAPLIRRGKPSPPGSTNRPPVVVPITPPGR